MTLAVGEAILAQKTPAAEMKLAVDIVTIAGSVKSEVAQVGTMAGLVALAQAEAVKLPNQQEVLAAETLLTALQPILQQYVGSSLTSATAQAEVATFLGWVITAATPYTG